MKLNASKQTVAGSVPLFSNAPDNLICPDGQIGSVNIQNEMSSSSVTVFHPSISRPQSGFPLYSLPNEIVASLWL